MANNLTSLFNPFSERTTFVYDALNRAVTVTHGNTTKAQHDYNAAGWLTALRNLKSDNSAISIFTYTYDNAANRLSMEEANGDRVTWTYDAIDQLTRERRSGANSFDITYTYDPVGNRLTKLQSGTTTTYAYDSANELTTEQAGATVTTYTFDNNGNTTVKNVAGQLTTYTWDGENRMTKLEQPTSPAVMTFTYDGNSYRRTLHDGTSLTKFLNDWVTGTPGIDPVLIETDASDSTIVTYTPGMLLGLLSQRRSGASRWYHFEAIGSTRQLTDSSQVVTDTYLYEAFGKEVVTSGTTVNMLRYIGQLNYYTDGKSGLSLLGARLYQTGMGRFVSTDPSRAGGSWSTYVGNSPSTRVDPTGLDWVDDVQGTAIAHECMAWNELGSKTQVLNMTPISWWTDWVILPGIQHYTNIYSFDVACWRCYVDVVIAAKGKFRIKWCKTTSTVQTIHTVYFYGCAPDKLSSFTQDFWGPVNTASSLPFACGYQWHWLSWDWYFATKCKYHP